MRKNYSNSKGCIFNTHEHNYVLEVSLKIHVGIKRFHVYVFFGACFTCLPVGASLVQLANSFDVQFALGWRRQSNTKYSVLSVSRSSSLLQLCSTVDPGGPVVIILASGSEVRGFDGFFSERKNPE